MTKRDPLNLFLPPLALLLLLWVTRITALDAFPFHVDEGIHIRWAIEVWNGHPFWNISDAKIIAHWPIAALYPQHAAPFVARMPTVWIALLGLAAFPRPGEATTAPSVVLWRLEK